MQRRQTNLPERRYRKRLRRRHRVAVYHLGEDGKCSTATAVVLGSNRIQVKQAEVRLQRAADLLLADFNGYRIFIFYKAVKASDICRKSDGTYAEGAPGLASTS